MKNLNSTYLVASYLKKHKKSYIHKMKTCCKANNIGQRVLQLRRKNWDIKTVFDGYKDRVPVYHYEVVNVGEMPKKYI